MNAHEIIPVMDALRAAVDAMEIIVEREALAGAHLQRDPLLRIVDFAGNLAIPAGFFFAGGGRAS